MVRVLILVPDAFAGSGFFREALGLALGETRADADVAGCSVGAAGGARSRRGARFGMITPDGRLEPDAADAGDESGVLVSGSDRAGSTALVLLLPMLAFTALVLLLPVLAF